jgi:hypothetical protein
MNVRYLEYARLGRKLWASIDDTYRKLKLAHARPHLYILPLPLPAGPDLVSRLIRSTIASSPALYRPLTTTSPPSTPPILSTSC